MLFKIQTIDEALMLFIQDNIRCDFLTPIMKILSLIGVAGAVWIFISLILFCTKKHRKTCFLMLLSMGICFVINDLTIKNLVCRVRPTETVAALSALLDVPSSWSFPSGHACSCFVSCYVLARSFRKGGGWFYILGALISLSRCYVGLHYVSDILAGAAIGTIGAAILFPILSKAYNKTPKRRKKQARSQKHSISSDK